MPKLKPAPVINEIQRTRVAKPRTNGKHNSTVVVATDSEWDLNEKDPWICTSFATDAGAAIVFWDDLGPAVKRRLRAESRKMGVHIFFVARDDGTNLLDIVREAIGVKSDAWGRVQLLFFFSPKDPEYALGWDTVKKAIVRGHVNQRNAMTGRIGRCIVLRDLSGLACKKKLASFAAALGLDMSAKSTMDEYKANMMRGLRERPEEFLRYAVDDARVLLDLHARFTDFVRRVERDVLGLTERLLHDGDVPGTTGRLVADVFGRWLFDRAGEFADAVRFCVRKLGLLDPDVKNPPLNRDIRRILVRHVRTPERLAIVAAVPDYDYKRSLDLFQNARYHATALSGASVRAFAGMAVTESGLFNALVHGGRCHAERSDQFSMGAGLDIDMTGCYGTALRSLTYPVGLPTVWSWGSNERRPTLGEFLTANEADLVPDLYQIIVSGKLPFEQDLLHSKPAKAAAIHRAASGDGKIDSDFALLRREIRNAVLTADLLDALRKVATNAEWNKLMKLEVVTAAAYLESNRYDGPEEWCRHVMAAEDGSDILRLDGGSAADVRTRAWYGVPLEGFVGRLADERARARETGPPGLDAILKLLVNSLYGTLASPFFAVGNVVVANNVTARARLGAWMMAKALGLRQTITDGGLYDPLAVAVFKGRCPGLDMLSRPAEWHCPRKQRRNAPLPDFTWDPATPTTEGANAAATAHLREFWSKYDLTFPFELEHKQAFVGAAHWSKGDYALRLSNDDILVKLRGKNRESKRGDARRHPSFDLLNTILDGRDEFPADLKYSLRGILKVGTWRLAQEAGGDGFLKLIREKGLRPGDSLPQRKLVATFNNGHMPIKNEQAFLKRKRRRTRRRGRHVELFERYRDKGISAVHRHMETDNLAAKVRPPYPPKRGKKGGTGGTLLRGK